VSNKVKIEANKLLTHFIREIANEVHDNPLITGPAIDDSRMITKAEALARYIFKAALGYKETVEVIDKKTGRVIGHKEIIHPPDKVYVTMLYDRMEGRVPTVEVKETSKKATASDRVSKLTIGMINSIAKQ